MPKEEKKKGISPEAQGAIAAFVISLVGLAASSIVQYFLSKRAAEQQDSALRGMVQDEIGNVIDAYIDSMGDSDDEDSDEE